MTREEAIYRKMDEAVDMAIKALEQEPCGDAISRKAVLDGVDRYIYKLQSTGTQDDFYSFAELVVKQLPSVTPQQKTGRWMPIEYDGYADGYPVWDKWECSECGWEHSGDKESLTAFCPYCGAKMVGKED